MAIYNTTIALSALRHADDYADLAQIETARKFLIGGQKHDPEKKFNDGGTMTYSGLLSRDPRECRSRGPAGEGGYRLAFTPLQY